MLLKWKQQAAVLTAEKQNRSAVGLWLTTVRYNSNELGQESMDFFKHDSNTAVHVGIAQHTQTWSKLAPIIYHSVSYYFCVCTHLEPQSQHRKQTPDTFATRKHTNVKLSLQAS